MKIVPNKPIDPLDQLAAQAASDEADQAGQGAPGDDQQQADAAMAALELGAAKVILGLLKIVRGIIAKKLPEINDEWPDELLQAPADAAVPLIRRRMAAALQLIGADPELAVLAFASFPLVLGWIAANDKHAVNEKRTVDAKPAANDASA